MIPKPQLSRKWAICPYCGSKYCIYDNTSNCNGVFVKCTRNPKCRKEFELIIRDGEQEFLNVKHT